MGIDRYMRRVTGGRSRAQPKRPKTAFVLSGGGVLGAVQVGQLEALIDAGVLPDLLIGASVGAINAATLAYDPTPTGTARLREIWSALRTEDIFPGSRMQRAWHFVRRGDHLYPNTGIRRLIDMLPARAFEQMQRPLHVVAANLRSGKERWFDHGPLAPAILASCAIPGIFPPVVVDGELFVDGGVVNNVPISRAVELGATTVYVLTCGSPVGVERPIRRPLDVLMQAVAHSRAARVEIDVERYAEHAVLHVLPAPDTGSIRFNDMTRSLELIEKAHDLTAAYLAEELPARAVHSL